jgi:hypothetical protein
MNKFFMRAILLCVVMLGVSLVLAGCQRQPKEVIHVHETYVVDNSRETHVLSDNTVKFFSDLKLASDNKLNSDNSPSTTNTTTNHNNNARPEPVNVPGGLIVIVGFILILGVAVSTSGRGG